MSFALTRTTGEAACATKECAAAATQAIIKPNLTLNGGASGISA
jgi:hypothetical protein